jgi:hypothetical protein
MLQDLSTGCMEAVNEFSFCMGREHVDQLVAIHLNAISGVTDRQTDRQTEKETYRQTDEEWGSRDVDHHGGHTSQRHFRLLTDRQTDRQTDRDKESQTDR